MNAEEFKNMTEEQRKNLPWDAPVFLFVPGRYYLSMGFLKIPPNAEFPRGGDITSLVWRFDSDPDEWVITYRFRYYASPDVWGGKDRKSWYGGKQRGTEKEIEAMFGDFQVLIAGLGEKMFGKNFQAAEKIVFKGDAAKAMDVMQNNPPHWLHTQIETQG